MAKEAVKEKKKVGRPRIHPPRPEIINTIGDDVQLSEIIGQLKQRGKVRLHGLGILSLKRMPPHKALNVHTGKYEIFPSYVKLTFNISAETKQHMQTWL